MALFNRNKTKPVVLPELEKYYDAERRERSGLAWILALVSIAGVALVLIGMFFGGRWLYRNLTVDKANKPAIVQKDTNSDSNDKAKTNTEPKSNTQINTPATPAPVAVKPSTPAPATPAPSKPTPSSPSPTVTKPVTTPTATTVSPTTTKLSNTGPTSTVVYFVLTTITGTLLYQFIVRRLVR